MTYAERFARDPTIEGSMAIIADAVDDYGAQLAALVNNTPRIDAAFLVPVLEIAAAALREHMDPVEIRLADHIKSNAVAIHSLEVRSDHADDA